MGCAWRSVLVMVFAQYWLSDWETYAYLNQLRGNQGNAWCTPRQLCNEAQRGNGGT